MRIISCHATNFASYEELKFDFTKQGLTLVQGATGSGKSTLCDLVSWTLFGRSAKDGTVDEIRRWNSEETTSACLTLDLKDKRVAIFRTRAPNDLYFYAYEDCKEAVQTRGKDLNDTQKLINTLLGFDHALYQAAAYFHEFSQTGQFFIATAKSRRALCEQLVDLSLPKLLQTNVSEETKALEKQTQEHENKIQLYADRIRQLERHDYKEKADNFETDKSKVSSSLRSRIESLKESMMHDSDILRVLYKIRNQISALNDTGKCETCGALKELKELEELKEEERYAKECLYVNSSKASKVRDLEKELSKELNKENVFGELEAKRQADLAKQTDLLITATTAKETLTAQLVDLTLLTQVLETFRGTLITNTVNQLNSKLNQLLNDYFDAEIRVQLEVVGADKLEITIHKDGNVCSFSQLSKGQRQLLKFAFSVAVMEAVANQHGISFNCLFFDEALSGLDETMKRKAFSLFESLALNHESIFVIDHSEDFKILFSNRYDVTLESGSSKIEKT